MKRRSRRAHEAHGYSLVEMLIVVALVATVGAMAVPVTTSAIKGRKADSAVTFAEKAIGAARDRAVAERRNIELTFIMPNRIRLERQEINAAGAIVSRTTLSEVVLEAGQKFQKFTGVPDTPDAFGAAAAITFGGIVPTGPVMFTSDGSLIDAQGDVVNGSIFVGEDGQPLSARAVTIFGITGLTRSWKWRGGKWLE